MKYPMQQMAEAKAELNSAYDNCVAAYWHTADYDQNYHTDKMLSDLGKACKALSVTVDANGNVSQVNLPAAEESQPVAAAGDPAPHLDNSPSLLNGPQPDNDPRPMGRYRENI